MDLQSLFDAALAAAARGDHRLAAQAYEQFLDGVQGPGSPVSPAERPQLVRSAAFNLAQVLNKSGEYDQALSWIEKGLAMSPTAVGRAIALAAKGEALYGLKRIEDGRAALDEAVDAHPVIGRLNAADTAARVGPNGVLRIARKWIDAVLTTFASSLDAALREEAEQVREALTARLDSSRT